MVRPRTLSVANRLLLVTLVFGLQLASLPADELAAPPRGPVTGDFSLAFASDSWLVWQVDSSRDFQTRKPRYTSSYFRQRVGDETLELLQTVSGGQGHRVLNVLDNGVVLISRYSMLTWHSSKETRSEALALDGQEAYPVGAYQDGLLLQPYKPNAKAAVYFVPVVKGHLDYNARMQVTDDAGVSVSPPPRFVRSGARIAWNGVVFDLEKQSRHVMEAGDFPVATAIEDDIVVVWSRDGHWLVSLSDGQRRLIDKPSGPVLGTGRIFTVREGVGYFFDTPDKRVEEPTVVVKAISLSAPDATAQEVGRIAYDNQYRGLFHLDEELSWIRTEKGLRIWNGKLWATVGWLKG